MQQNKPDWPVAIICMWIVGPAIALALLQVAPSFAILGPVLGLALGLYIMSKRQRRSHAVLTIRKPTTKDIALLCESLDYYWDKDAVERAKQYLERLLPQLSRSEWDELSSRDR